MRPSTLWTAPCHPSRAKHDLLLITARERHKTTSCCGAIAQLGERVNGIHEVGGSIPPGSTNKIKDLSQRRTSLPSRK
jgi:hypothetical protein